MARWVLRRQIAALEGTISRQTEALDNARNFSRTQRAELAVVGRNLELEGAAHRATYDAMKPGRVEPIGARISERELMRFAELKYRQLKEHCAAVRAELRAAEVSHGGSPAVLGSSKYLEFLEVCDQIPQLRHIATRYLEHGDAKAIEHDVAGVLEASPYIRRLATWEASDISVGGDEGGERCAHGGGQ